MGLRTSRIPRNVAVRRATGLPSLVRLVCLLLGAGWPIPSPGQPFALTLTRPSLDRWMYPHNATPGTRPTAPVFGTLDDASGVDSRHGQFLVGFDLSDAIAPDQGPGLYLIRGCRLSFTVSRDR